ncbi:3-ketoacyl-acyl carrier protein synthase III [Actinidia rufa]|uniref:3-ketoacyl-acyl carrier protein synthase III n=1 Tax=Actinidia rufa TaxID=165716 RepID=A0A7J0FR53_9ERIC|nr:3-ketoacyl-acyl carrier protein synthase III [Actinidia rufa]
MGFVPLREYPGGYYAPAPSKAQRGLIQVFPLLNLEYPVPTLQVSNDDLAKIVDTSDEWISVRTGIRNRRVITGKDSLTALAAEAAKNALQMAEVDPDDLDLVLLCTSTPDDLFGSAPQIQKALGCKRNPLAYDITAACSGFVLGLISAACYIRGGGFNNVLVIGADALSRHVDWTDRGTCILFGDAAGAVVVQVMELSITAAYNWLHCWFRAWKACGCRVQPVEERIGIDLSFNKLGRGPLHALFGSCEQYQPKTEPWLPCDGRRIEEEQGFIVMSCLQVCNSEEDGLFGFDLHSDGDGQRRSSYSCIQMNGKEVFRFAVRCVPQSIESALKRAGLTGSSIDWLLLHQANQRIIDAVATRLEVPLERVISNLANYGNTSAASIPLALDEAVRSGKVQSGHTIAAAGFGAGLTWGSAIVRWG